MLCDSALVYGFGYELKTIDPAVIEQVIKDKGGMGIIDEEKNMGSMPSSSFEPEVNRENGNRLQRLENAVESMQRKVDSLIEVIQKREEGLKGDLVVKLKNLLFQERKRSGEILENYSQLKVKYDNLMKNGKDDHSDQKWVEKLIKKELVKRIKETKQSSEN